MTKSKNFWNSLLSTLWFVPMFLVIGGILLGFLLIGVDYTIGAKLGYFPRLFGIQPSGARDLLAVIASSTITVAGTVFSITIVALTLASTQFSPRILRNFMRDTGNQVVLGVLGGIFSYCIVVLRTIREGGNDPSADFVPTLSVFFSILLGVCGVGFLIYFIHHVATSIQATSIVALIAQETIKEIKNNYATNEQAAVAAETAKLFAHPPPDDLTIDADKNGYIQNADVHVVVRLAQENNLVLKMVRRIGQFSVEGLPVLQIISAPPDFKLDKKLEKAFQETYDIGTFRTVEGDVAFGIRQIVDIALKALSPAVNDTTTALICIDYLSAIMCCLARRPSCPSYFFGENGKPVLFVDQQRFEDFFDLAFNQIRQNAAGNVAVILRQVSSINILTKINLEFPNEIKRRERHELMATQAQLLFELAQKTVSADADLEVVNKYYGQVEKSLAERENII